MYTALHPAQFLQYPAIITVLDEGLFHNSIEPVVEFTLLLNITDDVP